MWFAEARKIYILPVGKITGPVIGRLEEVLPGTFGKEIEVAEELPLPVNAYDRERQQCHSTKILQGIARTAYDGMVLAVIDADLYVPGLNFVFGEADPENGVSVISITRLRGPVTPGSSMSYGEHELFLQRSVKEAVHEIGHLYGLSHCPSQGCAMHFSDTLSDTDLKTEEFCELCKGGIKGGH